MHHPVGCKLSSKRRNSLENLLIQKSPKICPKYNELIELNEYNKSAIYSPPFGRGRGGLLHPPDTLDTLLRRVQAQCLSALWHPYTLKHKILARTRAWNRMSHDKSEHRAPFKCKRVPVFTHIRIATLPQQRSAVTEQRQLPRKTRQLPQKGRITLYWGQ